MERNKSKSVFFPLWCINAVCIFRKLDKLFTDSESTVFYQAEQWEEWLL